MGSLKQQQSIEKQEQERVSKVIKYLPQLARQEHRTSGIGSYYLEAQRLSKYYR